MTRLRTSQLAAASLALTACVSPQLGNPCPIRENGTPEQREADIKACFQQTIDQPFNTSLQKDVDILFLIDNSPSMSPKQQALAQNIPRFIQAIEQTGANYHVGIATSDVGSYVAPGQPWSVSLGACNSFEGDDGTLQRVACNTRSGVSPMAIQACNSLCPDPKFVPQGGQGFISKVNGVTNVPREMVMGRDVGPEKTFQCIALVGDAGCGIEGQLEGAKRALDGHNPMNNGFLRPGSVLAVIFITDEDDCSVSLSRRSENDPVTMDCPTGDKNAPAACFNADYRCLARSVVCNEPLNTEGTKTNCVERDNSYLEKVETYVKFFSALRPANKLLISGIWTTPSLDRGGKFVVDRRGGTRTEYLNRAEGANAGCVYVNDNNVFGRPQIRLSKFARQFKDAIEISVCDVGNYPRALDSIATAIKTKLEANCLPTVPKTSGGKPICLVGDVDARTPNNAPDVSFPLCSPGCCDAWANAAQPTKDDPGIRDACMGDETAEACYCALPSKVGACMGGAVLGVWRKGGADGPPDKVTNVKCAGS